MTLDASSPVAICKGSPRPIACALTRATRILVTRQAQWEVTEATSTDYSMSARIVRAGIVVVAGLAVILGATRLA